jgi:hypothetical protein
MFGIHAASIGGVSALMAKVELMVCRRIYENERASPIPRYIPMPPFRFLLDRLTPMIVRINEAKEVAMRL